MHKILFCADCGIDKEPCMACYNGWWKQKYPNWSEL